MLVTIRARAPPTSTCEPLDSRLVPGSPPARVAAKASPSRPACTPYPPATARRTADLPLGRIATSDEVGAVRRFCYLGNWIRQRLAGHSDEERSLTYAGIDPLVVPAGEAVGASSPARYEGTIRLRRIVDGERTLIEWPVVLETAAGDDEPSDAGTAPSHPETAAPSRSRQRRLAQD